MKTLKFKLYQHKGNEYLKRIINAAGVIQTLEWVALKKGKQIVYIDPWYSSSKTCSCCGHVLDKLDLIDNCSLMTEYYDIQP